MNLEMRRKLARLPFEEKIRLVGKLIRLGRDVKPHRRIIADRAARVDWRKVDAILARVAEVPPEAGDER
jgi:pheromone shutdown protein TraB